MSNKTQLQTNNTALDSYIARINAAKEVAASLPEAGGGSGGGSMETCTIRFYLVDYVMNGAGYLYYMKPDLSIGVAVYQATQDINNLYTEVIALKNSVACVVNEAMSVFEPFDSSTTGEISVVTNIANTNVFLVNGDGYIHIKVG